MQKQRWNVAWLGLAALLSAGLLSPVTAGSPAIAPVASSLGDQPATVPSILSSEDQTLYSQIFDLQDDRLWDRADALIPQLGSKVLLGHVLADRYLGSYRAKYAELAAWLEAYSDLPQAAKIHALAKKRHPRGKPWPKAPANIKIKIVWEGDPDLVPPRSNASDRRKVALIEKSVKRFISAGKPSAALKLVEGPKGKALTPIEADYFRYRIAASFYYSHVDERAYELAHTVAERRRDVVPMADWIAGLAAWRIGKPETAARHFETLAQSDNAGSSVRPAAAYWAARSNLVAGVPERVTKDLKLAAKYPLTFYGLLALRQLGQTPKFTWTMPSVAQPEIAKAAEAAPVKRAIALAQIGEIERADEEMRRAHAILPSSLDRALIVIAEQHQLAGAQLHVAETSGVPGLDGALYPIPAYKPQNGFTVDPALIYAFMRQESKFKPQAKSHAGATGLMQIMPATAALVAHDRTLKKHNRAKLYDASYNLRLAQRYIEQLLGTTQPRGNLFMLAVAYNGGPGNLRKWYNGMPVQDDPLLFIESIPSRETRIYVERVLANLWIYRYRLSEPVTSLDMVASGTWPVYDAPAGDGGRRATLGGAVDLRR